MSRNSPNSRTELIEEKRKLLYYIAQCPADYEQLENINVDIPQISLLLQLMGFQLERFEKTPDLNVFPTSSDLESDPEKTPMKIELICSKSGMRSTLIKHANSCKCPSESEEAACEFWNVSGIQPCSKERVTSSNSSLLPKISQAKAKIVNTLLVNIFQTIDRTADAQKAEKRKSDKFDGNLLSRRRSLDTLKSAEDVLAPQKGLKRHLSWEVDPNMTPPGHSSSPIPALCKSVNRISLDSTTDNHLLKNLNAIKNLVEDTIDIVSKRNTTYTKENSSAVVIKKRVSDIKPTDGPNSSDLLQLSTPPLSKCVTPRKMITPNRKNITASVPRKLTSPAQPKFGMLSRKPLAQSTSSFPKPSKGILLARSNSPMPKGLFKQSGSCENILKSKIAGYMGSRGKSPSTVSKGDTPGTSGIAKFKNSVAKSSNVCPRKKE